MILQRQIQSFEHWYYCLQLIPATPKQAIEPSFSFPTNISMTLNIYYSLRDKVFKLVNIDGLDTNSSLNRNIDSWTHEKAEDINITYWKNDQQNELNPFKYSRVGIHYSVNNKRYRKYYFCINEIISLDKLKMTDNL